MRGNMIFGYRTVSIMAGQVGIKRIAWLLSILSTAIFLIGCSQLQNIHDLLYITGIGLVLTFLNTSLWQRLEQEKYLKGMLRLQKSVLLFYVGALLILIIYRYVLFFVYDIILP